MLDYWLPLKEPFPEFRYDLSVWSEYLLSVVGSNFPPYLKGLEQEIKSYAAEKESLRPVQFRSGYRIYVFDHRLGTQLALFDTSGKTADWCANFVKDNFRMNQYVYGDGELIGPQYPGQIWDNAFLNNFVKSYGFAPIDELGHSWLVIFKDDSFSYRHPLAPWQIAFLLMKFRNRTLINWSEILKDSRYR